MRFGRTRSLDSAPGTLSWRLATGRRFGAHGVPMTTTYIPKADERDRKWFVIDAKDQVLGKLAATAADAS